MQTTSSKGVLFTDYCELLDFRERLMANTACASIDYTIYIESRRVTRLADNASFFKNESNM